MAAHALCETAADALHRKGFVPGDDLAAWLEPRLAQLTRPDEMVDRTPAAQRIARAIRAGERIAVFGDYDCDGITSSAIMTSALRSLGGEVVPLLATRTEGAYGLSVPAAARVLASGATLLITCDCGSSDHPRIADLAQKGIETVVIDHHLVPAEPLPAVAFLNPHRPDCGFPFKYLASCGLALSMAAALRKELAQDLDLRPLLDLVAIGTIADVVPLVGDNRILTRAGLTLMRQGRRPGLRALMRLSRIDVSLGVSSEDIAFRIAPRINAPGRLSDPDDALKLLLATDSDTAEGLSSSVELMQLRRRELQVKMLDEALFDMVEQRMLEHAGLVLGRQGWHPGIVGIVAGKMADTTGKPTVVLALEGPSARGSVRGPRGFPLYDALSLCKDTLEGFGGHQAAAGVHVRSNRVDAFRAAWIDACAKLGKDVAPPNEDAELVRLAELDDPREVLRDLARLEPFGERNSRVRLYLPGAKVESGRDLKGHLKLSLELSGQRRLSAIGFSMGARLSEVKGKRVDMVGTLTQSQYEPAELIIERLGLPVATG